VAATLARDAKFKEEADKQVQNPETLNLKL
jgi:hypothetical protein